MPAVFPTQIEQINDYSHLAGRQVLQAMRDQLDRNPWDKARELIDTAMTNHVNRLTADAVAQYNQGIESGLTAAQALAGIDSWIAGSDKFRDQADKIRASRISQDRENRAEAMWAKTQADAARELEANALEADYIQFSSSTPSGSAIWLERNQDRLRQNPLAYQRIMDRASKANAPMYLAEATADAVNAQPLSGMATARVVDDQIAKNRKELSALSSTGIFNDLAQNEERYKSLENYINSYAKQADYKGGAYSDFRENIQTAYNKLKAYSEAHNLNLPDEAILWAIDKNMQSSFWWFTQDYVDDDAAANALSRIAPGYNRDAAAYTALSERQKALENARSSGLASQVIAAQDANIARLQDQLVRGLLTQDEFNRARQAEITKARSATRDLMEKILLSRTNQTTKE